MPLLAPRSRSRRRPQGVLAALLAFIAIVLAPASAARAAEDPFDTAVRHDQSFARARLAATTGRISTSAWPHTAPSLRWTTTGGSAWTSGFLPGALWYAYQESADPAWRAKAQSWQAGLAGQASNTSTHDLGFMVFDSFGNGYRLTGVDSYRRTVLKAAASLATRYSPAVGSIRSWDSGASDYKVIIDNLMNLELLFWASKHGGQRAWYDMAVSHALNTARDHVRPDGSTYHIVTYDPGTGRVKSRGTVQGHSSSSTWARGQAWAIHGFTAAYRETHDARLRGAARRVCDWFIGHLPADRVPYWDFDDPAIPRAPRDTSAAAIAASGLLELATLETDSGRAARYASTARAILAALSKPPWLSEGSGSEATLLHGTSNKPSGSADTGLIYGDYYFQEALVRLRRLAPAGAPLRVAGLTASSGGANAARNAIDGNLGSSWSAAGDGQWLRVDLGAPRRVGKVSVAFGAGDQRATRFDLEASTNGSTWTTLTRTLSSGTTLQRETYDVPDTIARYVRLVGHGAGGTSSNSVSEIAVR